MLAIISPQADGKQWRVADNQPLPEKFISIAAI